MCLSTILKIKLSVSYKPLINQGMDIALNWDIPSSPKETILMLGLSEGLRASSGHEGIFILPPQILIN